MAVYHTTRRNLADADFVIAPRRGWKRRGLRPCESKAWCKPTHNAMRILVVEDDPVLSDGLKVGLSMFGITPDIVSNCADGRSAMTRCPTESKA